MSTESIEKTYEWAKEKKKEWDGMVEQEHPMVTRLDAELTSGGDHPVAGISFAEFKSDSFTGEVGKNDDGDLIFHFWPTNKEPYNRAMELSPELQQKYNSQYMWVFGDGFEDHLGDAFLAVFKFEERLCWDYVAEMNSWVVRAQGFGENLMADELATKLFHSLRDRLEK